MTTPYFLSMINPATVVMGALFLIFFALLVYILSKVFRDKYGNVSTMTVGIISFCISVLIVYFGRYTLSNIIDSLSFSGTILYILSAIVVLILLYLFRRRLRFCMILMLIGAGLVLIGALTDWFYQRWFVVILGVGLLLLGIWLCSKKNLKSSSEGNNKKLLIKEAKNFKRKANRSKNPKFNGGWTHFINYLKGERYGTSEATIANYFGVGKREFVGIFNRYGLVR